MVERFVERIASPVLTDIQLTWRTWKWRTRNPARPGPLRRLAGVVHGRYRNPGTDSCPGGMAAGGGGSSPGGDLPAEAADTRPWDDCGPRAIHRLERELHDGHRPELVESITRLGLRHA